MRRLFFLLVMCFCLSFSAMADDLLYMTESQAKAAVELLQKQKYVLLYCSCCAGDYNPKTYVKIESVSYRYTGFQEYYEVLVEGVDAAGNRVSETVDLAYTYIQKKKKGNCVGLALKFFCVPCEKRVKWECVEF